MLLCLLKICMRLPFSALAGIPLMMLGVCGHKQLRTAAAVVPFVCHTTDKHNTHLIDRLHPTAAVWLMQSWRKRFAQLANMVAEIEQQQTPETGSAAASPSAAATTAALGTAAAAAGPVLTVLSLEGSKLKLMHNGLTTLTLSAYHIDTELLFTTQPFSSLSAAGGAPNSSVSSSASQGRLLAGRGPEPLGLGKVAFVQPTARVVLQLPVQTGTQGVAAVLPTASTGSTASMAEQLQPAAVTDEDKAAAAGSESGAAGSAGGCCCVLDVDVLMPQLASQSVLLEVASAGVSRTLPR
jgi:hypothetical protein